MDDKLNDKMDLTLFLVAHKCVEMSEAAGNIVRTRTAATVGVLVALDVPLFGNPKRYIKMIADNAWDAALRVNLQLSREQCREIVENVIEEIESELEEERQCEDGQ
ncbi:MAG: hypothetical protein OXE95_00695 [Chloroflexi bacterium]|nr:hypothetical protein [Chloroflexota bacterium]MCY4246074.1 hypothetical protein [Chloroflexota bacterium]